MINPHTVNVNTNKKPPFPVRLSHVQDWHFFEYALGLPDNTCVEAYVEENMVNVSQPLRDKTTIDLGTHVGFLHACRVDDWSGYHTCADGRIEIRCDDGKKGYFFDSCYTLDREEIGQVIEEILSEDRLHEAHILMKRVDQLKDKIGVPHEPDIVSKHSQSIQTITASDLMHLAMTTDKEFYAPVHLNPNEMSIGTFGYVSEDGIGPDGRADLADVLERMEKIRDHAANDAEQGSSSIGNVPQRIPYGHNLVLGYVHGCDVDDWPGFKMLQDDMVSCNGLKMTISQAYKEICKSNPSCEANKIMTLIEQIRQSCTSDA